MLAPSVLAAVVAVLSPAQVCFVDTVLWKTACTALPTPGVTVFATPDRKALVPLQDEDRTLLLEPGGAVESWRGRFFPIFFDEADRTYAVIGGELVTVSYPERLALSRTELKGISGVRVAACSPNGQLAALVPAGDDAPSILLVAPRIHKVLLRVGLPARAVRITVMPDESYAVALLGNGTVAVVSPDVGLLPVELALPGMPTALAIGPDGRRAVLGLAQGSGGWLIGLKMKTDARQTLKEAFRVEVGGPVRALALTGDGLVVLVGDRVELRAKGGRQLLRDLAVPGAYALAVLPDVVRSTIPSWDEE